MSSAEIDAGPRGGGALLNLDGSRLRRLRWWAGAFVAIGAVATISLELAAPRPDEALFSALLLGFPIVGFFVLSRRPDERIAWLMVAMGVGLSFFGPFGGYGAFAIERGLPLGPEALAISGPGWVPFIGISGYLLLLFPDGRLPSPRWRWFAWAAGIGLVVVMVVIWVYPGDFADSGYPEVRNPFGLEALRSVLDVFSFLLLSAPLLIVGGFVGLVVRLRRTTDDVVRHQIRWLTYAAALMAAFFVLSFVPGAGNDEWSSWIQSVSATLFMLIPVIVGVAILRYRLYDIDVVIKKTVVFAVLAAFTVLVYVGIVVGVGALVGRTDEGRFDSVLTVAAAGIVALVFQPIRTRARRFADRLVYGERATPYEVLGTFGDQLAGTYSADDVLPRIARVLGEGVGADRAHVWLRVGDELRVVAAWPSEAADDGDDDFRTEVRHQGEELGALSVSMPPNDPMNETKAELVRHLAGQAGLVLSNVRLTEELRARLDDLRAAQKRLVNAQDDARRKLERNIHDGAQQQLVALAVKARLARTLTDRDPAKAAEMLGQIETETQTALEDLRDLARGIYPPLLADKGLPAAIAAQARKVPFRVEVRSEGVGRYPAELEAAVYFSCLEALQNTAKYAGASEAVVSLEERDGVIAFEVSDDGRGFDIGAKAYGTGLQGISDRLVAIDGALTVRSAPGEGTTVSGTVPVRSMVGVSRPEGDRTT